MDNPSSIPSSSSSFLPKRPYAKYRGRAGQDLYPVQQISSAQTELQRQQGPLPTLKEVPKLQRLGSQDQPVGGILQSHLHAWCQITDNPWAVPKKDGGWRPIINLKSLNSYLVVSHFKMENIGSLEDAYFLVPVQQEHRDFLKFC